MHNISRHPFVFICVFFLVLSIPEKKYSQFTQINSVKQYAMIADTIVDTTLIGQKDDNTNAVCQLKKSGANKKDKDTLDLNMRRLFVSKHLPAQEQVLYNLDALPTITYEQINQNMTAKQTHSDIIVLDFEGLGNSQQILEYYNGGFSGGGYGPGPDYGITFSGSTLSIIAEYAGGTGRFQNEPSPVTVMFFLDEDYAIMSVEAGFQDGFSFYYSSIDQAGSVEVYDQLSGNGDLLASLYLEPLGSLDIPGGIYNIWEPIGVAFEGTAKSVKFIGAANYIGFDDITFGSDIPGDPVTTPSVITLEATSITASSANIGGDVTYNGGLDITDRGFYWGSEPDVINNGTQLPAGDGMGTFLLELESLNPNATYYFAAYAVNTEGKAYGEEKQFTTLSEPPAVITGDASEITFSSATISGQVIFDGGANVTERGFYYGVNPNPQSTGERIFEGNGTGQFSSFLSDLIPATTYYYKAFATNLSGIAYGSVKSFVTENESVFIPNAFMPNSHIQANQIFKPELAASPIAYSLEVFNYWGEKLFSSNDVNIGWDGTVRNSDAPQGTYIYKISYIDLAGEEQEFRGAFMLIR